MGVATASMWSAIALLVSLFVGSYSEEVQSPSLLVVTVATDETDGLARLRRSAKDFGIDIHVFGLGEQWTGGDTRIEQGGGQKIGILKRSLEEYKDRKDLIILFVDAYDVVFNGGEAQILEKFFDFYGEFRVVFGAEPFCWPNKELAPSYPLVNFGQRYLNSGLFMGYAPEIWQILNHSPVEDKDDDQLYYTNIYLDKKLRESLKMTLDSMSFIFQNLNGVKEDILLEFNDNGDAQVTNVPYTSHPLIVHGNGASKLHLDHLANYIGHSWSKEKGCLACQLDHASKLNLKEVDKESWPSITLAILIAKPIPFIREFLDDIERLDYPTSRIDVYVYNNQKYNEKDVDEFMQRAEKRFRSVHVDNALTDLGEQEARSYAMEFAGKTENNFLLMIDGEVHLTNAESLRILVETASDLKLGILAPMVAQTDKLFSNFWGSLSENGYYARSDDYVSIVKGERIGVWNVPFIGSVFLMNKEKIAAFKSAFSYNPALDPDMSLCEFARHSGHFMYVDNRNYYGSMVVIDDFDTTKVHPEMFMIFDNRQLWESRFIHDNYLDSKEGNIPIDEPCQDVFDFPLMSETFCENLIEEMENFGKWSNGNNQDNRLAGGYENVPTRDIHMNQIGFERHWLYMMDEYVRPIQEKLFSGYYKQPVESNMMFVVRFNPAEQAALRPHHDASTYSIDVALNKRDVDYEGGGVRYVRYNCTVDADQVGYSMIFPGRLTHLHEGLPTTKGTRYIAVTFLNP